MVEPQEEKSKQDGQEATEQEQSFFYRFRFRDNGQEFTGKSSLPDLQRDDVVMVRGEYGLEPAFITSSAPACRDAEEERRASYELARRAGQEECARYTNIPLEEASAFTTCKNLIQKHSLQMRLVRVERFFNGSKMIFYFTADKRVDFRALVKDLVQEFRTRVEMRQVGVRHETKMLGGVGTCGRELCCSAHMKKFDSVSIKMAKEQDLPLNPAKISGVCNRLLCCLTYEFETYKRERKGMPKPGKKILMDGQTLRVKRQNPLQRTVLVVDQEGEQHLLTAVEWQSCEVVKTEKPAKKRKKEKKANKEE
ncbi:MAG: hypothetical protein KKD01_13430 [Proteobacteria bacterium]|nr:hypothetical protein [Pseudomonadota bacterium]MBU1232690.1 hypothetical protein [Pseudomonadota bacterium]MBU1418855.1 hypothetical protein [Pseudomonadota bacterium]MBU1455721.1 hypothetical protein [Pseudomonadota bacterium]